MNNLYAEGKEYYSLGQVIRENVLVLFHVIFASVMMWEVQVYRIPVVSIGYIGFVAFMLLYFLRKHLCTHCYYYGKTCHCGWSHLARIHKKGSGNLAIAAPSAGMTWGVLTTLPVVVVLILTVLSFTWVKAVALAVLVILMGVQLQMHKSNCKTCKMRYMCPGSACKEVA